MSADGAEIGPGPIRPGIQGGHVEVEAVVSLLHPVQAELGSHDAVLVGIPIDGAVGHGGELVGLEDDLFQLLRSEGIGAERANRIIDKMLEVRNEG